MAFAVSPQASGMEETTLWTNSSPTSSMSDTTITLSQDYTNFDYIKFTYRVSTSNSTEYSAIYPRDTVGGAISGRNANKLSIGYTGTYTYVRVISRTDANTTTKLSVSKSKEPGDTGTGTTNIILTKISGLKV